MASISHFSQGDLTLLCLFNLNNKVKVSKVAFTLTLISLYKNHCISVYLYSTWYVVALGLDASREDGVFRDGVTVVIQWRKLSWDFSVSRDQNWRKNYTKREK